MSPVPVPARLPAAARGRQARPAPASPPERLRPGTSAPRLRLVDNRRLELAARRRRARRLGFAAAVLALASLLALAGTHAMLVSNQVRLDALAEQAAQAQADHQALRLEVATLEDPARVVSVATERLGMVAPEVITYLPPVVTPEEEPRPPAPSPPATATPPAEVASAARSWSAVKPYLDAP